MSSEPISLLSPAQHLNDLRMRVVSGEEVSPEEYALLRHAHLSDEDIADMDRQEPGRMDSVRSMVSQGKMLDRPVVLLLTSNGTLYVCDGFHRITATIEAGKPDVYAAVGLGDPLD